MTISCPNCGHKFAVRAMRGSELMRSVRETIPQRPEWTVDELADAVGAPRHFKERKKLYNVLNYLLRHGQIAQVGYGRYQQVKK